VATSNQQLRDPDGEGRILEGYDKTSGHIRPGGLRDLVLSPNFATRG
jgi:hypothetical protein